MSPQNKCLGLIGGLGVGATIHYYRELARACEEAGTPLRLLLVHADMHRVFQHASAGETELLARYFAELIGHLRDGGAEVAAISAVMPHLCIEELLPISPLPLVNLLEAVSAEIRARRLRRVALFGTRMAIESRLFGQLQGVEVVQPEQDEIEFIHDTYFQVASTGAGAGEQRDGLTRLAQALCQRHQLDAIVLAGTDLALLFDESNTDFPHVDCSRVHIGAIVRALRA